MFSLEAVQISQIIKSFKAYSKLLFLDSVLLFLHWEKKKKLSSKEGNDLCLLETRVIRTPDMLWGFFFFLMFLESCTEVIFSSLFAMCSYTHFLNTFPGLVLLLCICPTCVSYFLWLILTVLIKIYPLSWLWVMSPLAHFQQRCGLGLLCLILEDRPLEGIVQEA